ncbi:acyl-CoA dehydrogenase family protein [Streptomyces sp. CA-250714]|uniref:acyl-CoA dehydrogenase family protein n=1 Tax=Streptomyces sp. CA-250714 TaxID=3240060 RepID=UPI003D916303
MDFRLTEDQEALRRGMRELLETRFDRAALRGAVDGAEQGASLDAALWRELGESGLFALRAPESAGGVGLGLPEAVLVFEEAGRALLPGPLVASHLAGSAGLVAGAADGSVVVTAAEQGVRCPGRDGDSAPLVEHLEAAGAVLLLGEGKEVGVLAPGELTAAPIRSVDPLTPLHRIDGWAGEDTDAAEAAEGTDAADVVEAAEGMDAADVAEAAEGMGATVTGARSAVDSAALRREAVLLTAAQQLGSACRTLELAVGYAREREQFGRPIGAFQAVQQLCAGMLVRSETARSVVYAAAVTADDEEVCAAKLLADAAAVGNARDCLQIHGGMGFTWEADVHLHLKRAWLRTEQWRTAVTSEEQLASALLRPMCR